MYLPYFADFVCCKDLDSNSSCFVLKMYSSLPQLFVFLFDVLSVAVIVIRDRFKKKKKKKKTEKRKEKPTCA